MKQEANEEKIEVDKRTEDLFEKKNEDEEHENEDAPGFNHCRDAEDNFKQAEKEYEQKNFSKAFIHYNKAIRYAQHALGFFIEGKRDSMKSIVRKSEERQKQLEKESNIDETIKNTSYPRLKNVRKITKWIKRNIKYQSDPKAHGVRDYWQTPEETLILGAGDCEDQAFLVQALLKQIGIESFVIATSYGEDYS